MTSTERSQAEISTARDIRSALIPLISIAEEQNLAMLGHLLRLAISEAEQIMGEEPHSFARKAELGKR